MLYSYQVGCDRCGLRAEVLWPQWACYQWPTGMTIEIAQCWAWCADCGSVSVAEALKSVEQMDHLLILPVIAQAYDDETKAWRADDINAVLGYARYPRLTNLYGTLTYWKKWNVRQSVVLLNTLNLHRGWRLERASPPRCLTCGGTDIIPLAVDHEGDPSPNPHPACGGTIRIVRTRKIRARRLLWTTEGEVIGPG